MTASAISFLRKESFRRFERNGNKDITVVTFNCIQVGLDARLSE